jgi:hypothetical protein
MSFIDLPDRPPQLEAAFFVFGLRPQFPDEAASGATKGAQG